MTDPSDCQEIWVDGPHGQSLCALINNDVGWLMYLREQGDAGFSSRNPDYNGPPDACIDYFLSNGQLDSYPAAWAYPVATVTRAIEYFQSEGRAPPFIAWHNDSGDGEPPEPRPNNSFKPTPPRGAA
jgi:hypothetical protein